MSQTPAISHLPHKAGVLLKQLFTKLKQEIIFQFWFQIFLSFPRQWAAERTQIGSSWFLHRKRTCTQSFFENTSPSISFRKTRQRRVLSHSKICRVLLKELCSKGWESPGSSRIKEFCASNNAHWQILKDTCKIALLSGTKFTQVFS